MESGSKDLIILRPQGQNPGVTDLVCTSLLRKQIFGLLISVIYHKSKSKASDYNYLLCIKHSALFVDSFDIDIKSIPQAARNK